MRHDSPFMQLSLWMLLALSEAGYEIWAESIELEITRLLGR